MKIKILGLIIGIFLISSNLYAAGDLTVNGQLKHGQSQTVTSASSITFSGLDGNTDKIYEIILTGRMAVGGAVRTVRLGLNNNFGTNGFRNVDHRHYGDGTNKAGDSTAFQNKGGLSLGFTTWTEDCDLFINAKLGAESGRSRILESISSITNLAGNSSREEQTRVLGWWSDTTANITSLVIDFNGGTFTGTAILRTIPY